MEAIDQLFSSLIIPMFLCTLAVVLFGVVLVFRFEISCFLEDYALPAYAAFLKTVSAWEVRHKRPVSILDRGL